MNNTNNNIVMNWERPREPVMPQRFVDDGAVVTEDLLLRVPRRHFIVLFVCMMLAGFVGMSMLNKADVPGSGYAVLLSIILTCIIWVLMARQRYTRSMEGPWRTDDFQIVPAALLKRWKDSRHPQWCERVKHNDLKELWARHCIIYCEGCGVAHVFLPKPETHDTTQERICGFNCCANTIVLHANGRNKD